MFAKICGWELATIMRCPFSAVRQQREWRTAYLKPDPVNKDDLYWFTGF